jgi:hypothetical protein
MHAVARERSDHLVRIHVRRRPRARLEDVDRELVVVLSLGDRVAGRSDSLGQLGVQQPKAGVRARRRCLDPPEPPDDRHRHGLARHREVLDGLARLATPQRFVRHDRHLTRSTCDTPGAREPENL